MERHKLVYSTYVFDGDSSSFKKLLNSNPYEGIEIVHKEDASDTFRNISKKHLKKKSNQYSKLSIGKIQRVGQLYALVVAQNRGRTPAEIQSALWNLLEHLSEKHDNCPHSIESWCYYQKARAEHAEDPAVIIPPVRQPYPSPSEYGRAKEVFAAFGLLSMCGALTMGQTQNANESLHSIVWHNSPNAKYVGHKSIVASTALAVSTFNEGEMAIASVWMLFPFLHPITPFYTSLGEIVLAIRRERGPYWSHRNVADDNSQPAPLQLSLLVSDGRSVLSLLLTSRGSSAQKC